jgi:D-alanyl-D-alanine carboxypeptidase/D-alanyl-D-alanine-endopeptidase (penicillin-binding protein 4)
MTGGARSTRRVMPITALTAIALVPAIALTGVWQFAEASEPPIIAPTTTTLPLPPAQQLSTDLFSMRRHPTPLAERVAERESNEAFERRVQSLADDVGEASCLRIVDDADVISELRPALAVVPASNQKLLVAAVALDVLGADYRFRTELQAAAPLDGVIAGDVYFVGGGDPVLRTADVRDPLRYPSFNTTAVEPLVDQLMALGITRIEGDIVGDGGRYDDEFRAPGWGTDITSVDAGPIDALLVNDGLIGNGNYGLDPNRSAARIMYDMVVARGIAVTGTAANRSRPIDAGLTTLASVESRPLTDVLVEMLHTSDNNTAEMLVKEIGAFVSGSGSWPAGLEAIRSTLAGWEVPLDGVELSDGSGLSRANRVTCRALTALMTSTPVSDDLRRLLPVAGRDGTLADQLLGTEAEGRLQAKTGTLTDVKALTGSQLSNTRVRVDFALVLNGEGVNDVAVYEPVWKRLVALIDGYPIVIEPDIDRFAPR